MDNTLTDDNTSEHREYISTTSSNQHSLVAEVVDVVGVIEVDIQKHYAKPGTDSLL